MTNPRRLNQKEIDHIKTLSDVNEKKSFIQGIIIEEFKKWRKGFITCYTSFGKGYTFGKIIQGVNKKNPHFTHCFVSDAKVINEQFRENYVQEWNLKHVEDFVINSYIKVKKGEKRSYDCVYMDELDLFCNGEQFKKAIALTECKGLLGGTATLTKKQIQFLEAQGLKYLFEPPIEEAVLLGLVPDYRKLNLKVELSYKDRNLYASAMDTVNRYLDRFSQVWDTSTSYNLREIMNKSSSKKGGLMKEAAEFLEWKEGQVYGCALKWQKASQSLEKILGENPESIKKTVEIANQLKGKTVIFAYNQKVANQITELLNVSGERAVTYHTGISINTRKQNLKRFKEEDIQFVVCVKALNRGMDLPSLENGIQQFFNSTESASQQRFGRVCRYDVQNKGKSALLISLYVDDFELRKVLYQSLLLRWLKISQRNQTNITWIENTQQIFAA